MLQGQERQDTERLCAEWHVDSRQLDRSRRADEETAEDGIGHVGERVYDGFCYSRKRVSMEVPSQWNRCRWKKWVSTGQARFEVGF